MAEEQLFEERKEKVIRTLNTMFDFLKLNGEFRVEDHNGKLAVKITSSDTGRVVGRQGQTLESLQLIVNRIMFKEDETFPRVMLDIDSYASGEREPRAEGKAPRRRPRREGGESDPRFMVEQLEQQARDAAKEVKKWGESVKMPEMNAHDRRIIHMTLQDDPEISTESEGEGAMKKVVISLKKAE